MSECSPTGRLLTLSIGNGSAIDIRLATFTHSLATTHLLTPIFPSTSYPRQYRSFLIHHKSLSRQHIIELLTPIPPSTSYQRPHRSFLLHHQSPTIRSTFQHQLLIIHVPPSTLSHLPPQFSLGPVTRLLVSSQISTQYSSGNLYTLQHPTKCNGDWRYPLTDNVDVGGLTYLLGQPIFAHFE
ncbi:hypothetical protein BJ508DRAFT_334368 [Ascobolus immersus RN42]|uniref:Uncharacterized protein n=1 Tax=Ascobolus immersus RN42 TaxID=1160509 RepID=A0A3N4HIF9_ASCIM|nr:hypothetical protein BJ508DRAFT_334368 [Ascobolus immersus RN42]